MRKENCPHLSDLTAIGLLTIALSGCAQAIAVNEQTIIYFEKPSPIIVAHEVCHQKQMIDEGDVIIFWQKYLLYKDYACQAEADCGIVNHPACRK